MRKIVVLLVVMFLPIMLIACGGGGGGGDNNNNNTTALTVASKVSVVDAQLSGSVAAGAAPLKIGWTGILRALSKAPATTSDYYADKTQVWVDERSAEAFNEINNILCMVAQTKYDAMLNKGNYIALVDQTQCNSNKSDASSAGQDAQNQSSSSNMPDYMTFILNSSRVGTNPQLSKVWVHAKAKGSDPDQLILVKLIITEGTSAANPYGLFHMDFLGYPSLNGVPDTTNWIFKGTLMTELVNGEVLLKFAEQNRGSWPSIRKITLHKSGDTGTGSSYEQHLEMISNVSTTVESPYDIAFNPDFFLRTDGTNTVCLSRSQFEESSWRYGLYDSTGNRLDHNSGFSVNTKADGTGSYGFVGYWGLWLDNNATIINNKLYKFDYSASPPTSTEYNVFSARGKLKKHTKKLLTLNEIKNIPLNYNEWSGSTGTNYQVVWDGINFNKVAYMPQNCSNNCTWKNMSAVAIDLANLSWGNLNFWSQSLGGQVMVQLENCGQTCTSTCVTSCSTPTVNPTPVVFYAEDLVYPGDLVPTALECFDNCPQIDANGQAYTNMVSGPSTSTDYTFDTTAMILKLSGQDVILSQESTTNPWGVMSGAMFDPAILNQVNPATGFNYLACDWDHSQVCGWKAWSELPVFYTWETGKDRWNQLTVLQTLSGVTVTFEPPLQVKYVHHEAGSPFDGATFMMDYTGFGNLQGIPGKCVNMDTGLDADCSSGSGNTIQWVPAFIIPPTQAGGSLTTVSVDTTDYFVKPLEVQQRMKQAASGSCDLLTITSYPLPDLDTIWSDPSLGTNPVTATNEPTVTAAPAVIGGVVQ